MSPTDESRAAERLVGVRIPFADTPEPLRRWAARTLGGDIVEVIARTGGMSPAAAATLLSATGDRIFVKAVSSGIHPDTPSHFRHEIEALTALSALPPAPYRAALLSTYDDGEWVAIALDDIAGAHPDWTSARDRQAVLNAVLTQTRELTPAPPGVPTQSTRDAMVKHVAALRGATASEIAGLPRWAAANLDQLIARTEQSLEQQLEETYCHWDIRHDNIMVRASDRQPVLLDWGMSRLGPRWTDLMVFGLEWVDSPAFDEILAAGALTADEDRAATGFLSGIGCYLLMMATHPPHPSLPALNDFRRRLGTACLAGVQRRTGILGA